MTETTNYRFLSQKQYTAKIGDLVTMLNYTRQTTLDAVKDLTSLQLDFHYGPEGNSIGTLLAHIAAVEWAYSLPTFENQQPNATEKKHWGPALCLGNIARQTYSGRHLSEYLEILSEIRQRTLVELAQRDDSWLAQEFVLLDGSLVDHHWAWFHVFEDELSHRGQILLIRNHLLNDSKS